MKGFALCTQTTRNGTIVPAVDPAVTPYKAYVQCDNGSLPGNWGAYLFSGTGAQLQAINALPNVLGICAVTEGAVRWAELDNVIPPAERTRINTWLTNHGHPTIPAGWTWRQVIVAIYRRFRDTFDLFEDDIVDG